MSITSQILKKAFDRRNISKQMGVSHSMFYKWKDGETNPLDRTLKLMDLDNTDMIIDFLAGEAGGYFVKYTELTGPNCDLNKNVANIMKEGADVFKASADAAVDGQITIKECQKIKKEVREFIKAFESFMKIAESGKWDK